MFRFHTYLLAISLCVIPVPCGAANTISYSDPPKCSIWMEGEDCKDHNWVEGPSYHSWVHDYGQLHGGVLDLASWRLPECGEYFAKFPFKIDSDGHYIFYVLARHTSLASPFEWSIDAGTATEIGNNANNTLATTEYFRHAVTRIGSIDLKSGTHTLKISVRKPVFDWFFSMYSQQIDAIGIAPASWNVEGVRPPEPRKSGTGLWAPVGAAVSNETTDDRKAKSLVFETSNLLLEISPVNAGIRRVRFKNTPGVDILEQTKAASPFTLKYRDGVSFDAGKVIGVKWNKTSTVINCLNQGTVTEVRYTKRSDGRIQISSKIKNGRKHDIWRVDWCISPSFDKDHDSTWRIAQNVVDSLIARFPQTAISPGTFAFDWICLTNKKATFYAMFEDMAHLDTEVQYGAGNLGFSKFPRIKPSYIWHAPPLIVGAYKGDDWHPAADAFHDWWYSWAKTPPQPEWAKSIAGLSVGMDYYDKDAIQKNKSELELCRQATGVTLFHGSGWIHGGTECWYPDQMKLKPEEIRKFITITDSQRQNGGRSSIYTNALMLSRATQDYDVWGRNLGVVSAEGDLWLTEHATHHHPMVLPYPNEIWAEKYCQIMKLPVLTGKPDMLYIDQLGAVPAHIDFAPDKHKHQHYGEWTAGSARFLKVVRDKLVSTRSSLVTCIESPNPLLLQYANFSITGTNSVMRYVFPTYYGFYGEYSGDETPQEALRRAKEALLTGDKVLLLDARQKSADDPTRALIKDIINLKRKMDTVLCETRYREMVGLKCSEGLKASCFIGRDRVYLAFVSEGVNGFIYLDRHSIPYTIKGRGRVFAAGTGGFEPIDINSVGRILKVAIKSRAGIVEIR